jgi:hypothetical protein
MADISHYLERLQQQEAEQAEAAAADAAARAAGEGGGGHGDDQLHIDALAVPPDQLWPQAFELVADCVGNAADMAGHLEGATTGFSLEAQRAHALADRLKRLRDALFAADLKEARRQLAATAQRLEQAISAVRGHEAEDLEDLAEDIHMVRVTSAFAVFFLLLLLATHSSTRCPPLPPSLSLPPSSRSTSC